MKNLFENIRPYSEEETMQAVKKLFADPEFVLQLEIFRDKINVSEWVKEVLACKTQFEFHLTFANRVFHYFAEKTCTKIHYSGIENINPNNQYLFIGNHRDIVLDSSLLQIYYFKNGYDATRSAIGDNLISAPLFVELARLHKMFLVLRSGTLKEKINHTHLLSSYIHHSIFEEKESVWIAQGNGRTKNGDDKTQQGLLKMLTLADPENPLETLKQMQITPVTVSYQYEPCACLKARELALSENSTYTKQSGEDAESIINGITGFKGEVHFVIGKPLQQEFENIPPKLSLNEKLALLCDQIDRQIYMNYYLYPQNYIAIDIQENSDRFSAHYTQEDKLSFMNYLEEQSIVQDVTKEKMKNYLLDIYANPVRNKLRIEKLKNE
ncbi:MAG: 1-acyl-sn-glycerol-3-phosphate acyltransferase [Bacteroidetes bacterium]|nr:1-acyl-sn-glycerol-3-phosphate acyltransferase [Bacteroidota bacterium]MCL1968133.1 1-acyl-sn-glycerol-3-phosphate acyltransferase [Bacteroidota bacterium]